MTTQESPDAVRRTVEAVWRIESARLVAHLYRLTHDVGHAEELAQDALVAALEHWPRTGVPPNPGGWLLTTARNRAVDAHRRRAVHDRALHTLHRQTPTTHDPIRDETDDHLDDPVRDDLLRLLFTACHPALPVESRVALTLRCLAGLTTAQIARAFLVGEPTAAQRIVRAKRTLAALADPFAAPTPAQLPERLDAVLAVLYLIFNEGYSATTGDDWMRPELCAEALRLARLVAALLPDQPEALGLLALLELQASRTAARTAPDGTPVLLADQDRTRWDRLLVRRGLAALADAERVARTGRPLGPYSLQAAIAACHARAPSVQDTDWTRIATLYGALADLTASPVVELNRAVALGMAHGPDAGLAAVRPLLTSRALAGYPDLHAVHGDLLARAGRTAEARSAFARAAELTTNSRRRALFADRARPPDSP